MTDTATLTNVCRVLCVTSTLTKDHHLFVCQVVCVTDTDVVALTYLYVSLCVTDNGIVTMTNLFLRLCL